MPAARVEVDRRLTWFTPWRALLAVIFALGLYATVIRFTQGLGAATNLSDGFPWGLWIGFDVLVGVGLAAGGFVVAATVHVFGLRAYAPITRPAVLTAFLGYLMVIFALLFDLGRPDRIWHPLVMWNPHSVMFEVAWCVMLYTMVLALEFSPLVFERLNMERPLRIVHAVTAPLVIVGVLLSTLHQSSLGTLYVIVPDKLHGLWYTPLLPVFFFISAVAGGLAMTLFESMTSARALGQRLESELLEGLGRVIVVVLGVYAVWRLQDLVARGNLGLAFQLTPESVMFWGEMGLGVILPMVLFAAPRAFGWQGLPFFAAVLTIMGFVINRLNVAVTGMVAASGVGYVPSWMEFAVTVALVAAGFVLFALAAKHLPVFPAHAPAPAEVTRPQGRLSLSRSMLLVLWGLLAVGAVLLGASVRHDRVAPSAEPPQVSVGAAGVPELPAPYRFPRGAASPGAVIFRHESHVSHDQPGCAGCHANGFRLLEAGMPVTAPLSYERVHEGDLCAACHDGSRAFAVQEGCDLCHVGS